MFTSIQILIKKQHKTHVWEREPRGKIEIQIGGFDFHGGGGRSRDQHGLLDLAVFVLFLSPLIWFCLFDLFCLTIF